MNTKQLDNSEIIIPDEITKHQIKCHKCNKSYEVRVIKNQILVAFDCSACKEPIIHYTWRADPN